MRTHMFTWEYAYEVKIFFKGALDRWDKNLFKEWADWYKGKLKQEEQSGRVLVFGFLSSDYQLKFRRAIEDASVGNPADDETKLALKVKDITIGVQESEALTFMGLLRAKLWEFRRGHGYNGV
ncbi:MAG: hypothetical protein ACXABY_00895 [Candidatus Thorarchaeota archaeon]|jgi:hypothetical protein